LEFNNLKTIKHKHYTLEVDPKKNRVYFGLSGHVSSVDAIPDFESDWMKVLDEMGLKDGFTILGDQRKLEPMPQDVQDLQTKVQTIIMQKGCRKVAQLADVATTIEVNNLSRKSGLKDILRGFVLQTSAENWLDE
jgi:hypothetical protein